MNRRTILGVIERRKVLDLIGRLRSERVPAILSSHTLPDVFAATDRIVVMHRGRKVAEKRTGDTNSQELSTTWSAPWMTRHA
jgi:ABC-type sugar transport system ATPase subunit